MNNLKSNFWGGETKQTVKWAKQALPTLVRQAILGKVITYEELRNKTGHNFYNDGRILGIIGGAINCVNNNFHVNAPQIQALVVKKDILIPGDNINKYITEVPYDKLELRGKKIFMEGYQKKIYDYNKWEFVLDVLDIKMPKPLYIDYLDDGYETSHNMIGEGEKHKKLKNFIYNNPQKIGVKGIFNASEMEMLLYSGDIIDVSFQNNNIWIGVEVKSSISNSKDIIRGIFQCVKYKAVMDASDKSKLMKRKTRVILALGGKFPDILTELKNTLKIEVIDDLEKKFKL